MSKLMMEDVKSELTNLLLNEIRTHNIITYHLGVKYIVSKQVSDGEIKYLRFYNRSRAARISENDITSSSNSLTQELQQNLDILVNLPSGFSISQISSLNVVTMPTNTISGGARNSNLLLTHIKGKRRGEFY